jgi:hypothetical protein
VALDDALYSHAIEHIPGARLEALRRCNLRQLSSPEASDDVARCRARLTTSEPVGPVAPTTGTFICC